MHWFRSNIRSSARLALLALARPVPLLIELKRRSTLLFPAVKGQPSPSVLAVLFAPAPAQTPAPPSSGC